MKTTETPEKEAPARRVRGATTVHQAIREEILTLKREPGSALDEVSIAREFGLSRTPVREAILMLSSEGLVQELPNRSSVVMPLTMHRMNDMLDTWMILARAVSIAAIDRATDAQLDALRQAVDDYEAQIGSGTQLDIALALLAVQRGYSDAAHNFFLARYYPDCLDAGRRTLLLHYFPYASAEDLHEQARLHRELIDAIATADVAACNRIVGEQIAAILRVIRASLEPSIAEVVDMSTSALRSPFTESPET